MKDKKLRPIFRIHHFAFIICCSIICCSVVGGRALMLKWLYKKTARPNCLQTSTDAALNAWKHVFDANEEATARRLETNETTFARGWLLQKTGGVRLEKEAKAEVRLSAQAQLLDFERGLRAAERNTAALS